MLVSNDFSAQRKAAAHGITCFDPDGVIPEITRSSSEAETIRRLQARVRELESREPKLRFGFVQGTSIVNVVKLPHVQHSKLLTTDSHIDQVVSDDQSKVVYILNQARGKVDSDKIEAFERDCERSLMARKLALKAMQSREAGQHCEVAWCIENMGDVPAQDIEITIELPEYTWLFAKDDQDDKFESEPFLPDLPEPPWNRSLMSQFTSGLISPVNHLSQHTPRAYGPAYDHFDRSVVRYGHPKLRHKDAWHMGTVIIYFPLSVDHATELRCQIVADNLRQPIEMTLNVVFESHL